MRVIAFSPKSRMPLHCDLDDKVAIHVPFSLEAQCSAVINASWNFEFLVSFWYLYSLSRTTSTGLSNCLTCPVAARTLRSHHHYALMESHEARPLTRMTLLRLGPWLSPRPLACAADAPTLQLYYLHRSRSTFVAPFTASLNYTSYLSVISSLYSSTVALLPLPRFRPPPPMLPPNRSSKMD